MACVCARSACGRTAARKYRPRRFCKGYEYAKGRYVVLTDEELERVQSERDRAIQILHFAPAGSIPRFTMISPIFCAPDGGDKAYELLRRAMMEEHVVGVGQCVLWNRQDMLALIPEENGIRVQTLFYRQQAANAPFQRATGAGNGDGNADGEAACPGDDPAPISQRTIATNTRKSCSPPSSVRSTGRRSRRRQSRRAM